VLPKHRRQGIGTALLAAVRAAAREHGIAAFYGHHATPAGAAFAAHVGARDDQRDVRSMLALGGARLPAPVVAEGFELRSWLGSAPAELVASYARAREAMSDAPVPDGQVATTSTVEEVRDLEQTAARRGREVRVTTALNAAGDVVAFTDLRVSAPPEFDAATDDTGTVRAWRGRGLALAVKLESLRRLRDDRPDVQSVWTVNAEDNAAMRHINERIGFVPTVTLTSTVLEA
jgi:GNAT superfamily N-acetyltransferase